MSCKFRNETVCGISGEQCPWVYYCDAVGAWKESPKAPKICKIAEANDVPNGAYRVAFERHGYLYVDMGGYAIKVKNTYDNIPLFVNITKTKSGEYRLKK